MIGADHKVTFVLEQLMVYVQPGSPDEQEAATNFIRMPGRPQTVAEAIILLHKWKVTWELLKGEGVTLGPNELLKGLDSLLEMFRPKSPMMLMFLD